MRFLFNLTFFIILFFMTNKSSAKANLNKFYVISEKTENNRVKYKVIESNTKLISDQSRVSQRVIYEKIDQQGLDKKILMEAKTHLKSQTQPNEKSLIRMNLEVLSRPSSLPLWNPIKQFWSLEDEKDYSLWFSQNAGEDFNNNSNLFADCADVGLLFRWAYAHDKKLPIANTLSGSGKLFGHFSGSAAWDHLPTHSDWKRDERFKAALRYLFDNTYTHSIYNDLYPTEININYVHPGSLYMIIREQSGHTQTLFQFDANSSGIRTLWGNEPQSSKIYESWLIWERAIKNLFGRWRWPIIENGQWKLTLGKNMPGYSLVQFEKREELHDEDEFEIWVLSQLGLVDYDMARLVRQFEILSEALIYRLNVTAIGATICGFIACDPASSEYDSYSTSSRDKRLKQAQKKLFKLINEFGGLQSNLVQEAISKSNISNLLIEGYNLKLQDYILSFNLINNIKSDANLSFRERWGLDSNSSLKVQFALANQQFSYAMEERRYLFDLANHNCFQDQCDPQDEYINQLNTSKIDLGLTDLGQKLNEMQKSSELSHEFEYLNEIKNSYRESTLSHWYTDSLVSNHCEITNHCTLYDVLWRENSITKMHQWTHSPTDSLLSRWGL